MIALLILFLATILVFFGTRWAVRQANDRTIWIGMGVLYIWTFLGAWFFIPDALSGYQGFRIGLNYYYLMEKMFPFELGGDYDRALGGYLLFFLGLFAGLWWMLRKVGPPRMATRPAILVDHRAFLGIGILAAVVSFLLVRPVIMEAIAGNSSIYQYTRHAEFSGATLHAICNELACLAILIGWAVALSSRQGDHFTDRGHSWPRVVYPLALLVLSVYFMVLGNRHELFMAAILGSWLLLMNAKEPPWSRSVLYLLAVVIPLLFTGRFRDHRWNDLKVLETEGVHEDEPFKLDLIAHVPRHASTPLARVGERVLPNEMFAAHMSMYGVLRYHVPVDPGVSLRYLASAMVPRIMVQERPATAYERYAQGAHLQEGQGYTIHHATAWYINGGWPGVLVGGLVIGVVWGLLIRLHRRRPDHGLALRIFAILGTACWTAFLPILVRNGPEAFKGLVIEGLGIPLFLVLAAALVARWSGRIAPRSR